MASNIVIKGAATRYLPSGQANCTDQLPAKLLQVVVAEGPQQQQEDECCKALNQSQANQKTGSLLKLQGAQNITISSKSAWGKKQPKVLLLTFRKYCHMPVAACEAGDVV